MSCIDVAMASALFWAVESQGCLPDAINEINWRRFGASLFAAATARTSLLVDEDVFLQHWQTDWPDITKILETHKYGPKEQKLEGDNLKYWLRERATNRLSARMQNWGDSKQGHSDQQGGAPSMMNTVPAMFPTNFVLGIPYFVDASFYCDPTCQTAFVAPQPQSFEEFPSAEHTNRPKEPHGPTCVFQQNDQLQQQRDHKHVCSNRQNRRAYGLAL